MSRAPRRVLSPQFGVASGYESRRTPPSADYDDVDHHQAPPPLPHHHSFNDNNSMISFDHPNHQSEPIQFQQDSHSNYPSGYRDQHLPSAYRNTLAKELQPHPQTAPISSPPVYKILCVTNINPKVSDSHVKEALLNDFSRFGNVSVQVCHDNGERLGYIYFRSYEEAREARHAKTRTILFDRPLEIEPIYEPRLSPTDSPPLPPYPVRKRSMTPPDYYNNVHQHPIRRQAPPPPHPTYAPQNHHRPPSPHNYIYSARYPVGPPIPSNPVPYNRYSLPEPHFSPHPNSPYHSPQTEPHRSYPTNPVAHPFPPNMPHPVPTYGYPTHRERERSVPDMYPTNSPRSEHFFEREYIPPPPPHSSRISSTSHYPGPQSPPNPNYRPGISSIRRLTPPYAENSRYIGRDFKRARPGLNNMNDREESKPSRVIFISNLDPDTDDMQLREIFETFGSIDELEVKKISSDAGSGLIKFSSMDCAYRAKTGMNGKYIGSSKCRISYGKVSASRRLWLGGLGPSTTLSSLDEEFSKFGEITNLDYVSGRPYGYVEYETANQAQFAVMHLKSSLIANVDRRLRIEYVDSDKTAKQEQTTQPVEKNSRYRSPVKWDGDEQIDRKRSSSPLEICAKRMPPPLEETDERNLTRSRPIEPSLARSIASSSPDRSIGQNDVRDESGNDRDLNVNLTLIPNRERPTSLRSVVNIGEFIRVCNNSWPCTLVLRNFSFPSRMHMCSGQKDVIDRLLPRGELGDSCPVLKIAQRWRLNPQPKLDEVKRRMQSGNLGMFIIRQRFDQSPTVSSPAPKTPQSTSSQNTKPNGDDKTCMEDNIEGTDGSQPRPLKSLISYLDQKDAAGVISLNPSDGENSKLLYAFPPGEFAMNLLKPILPNLVHDMTTRYEFLVGVIVGAPELIKDMK